MSSQEWKDEQRAFEDGEAIECPHCGGIIYKSEFERLEE